MSGSIRSGFATAEGTARFAARHNGVDFYRQVQGVTVSSLGLGSYLGAMDDATDRAYSEAFAEGLRGGVNFLDTSLNYRHQRSELAVARAIAGLPRDEYVICTKAGYLVPNAVPTGVLRASDVVGGMHSMAPAFLADQLERSRQNLGLETIDVFYLHNPETQLRFVARDEFYEHVRQAFLYLEELVSKNLIRNYGTATWDGYRSKAGEGLSLTRLAQLAEQVAGPKHHFRFIQLPFNLALVEAFTQENELLDGRPANVLEVATRAGISVIASGTLMQARLARNLPDEIGLRLPGPVTDAQRAIQFTRSTPGIAVALVGMSQPHHVAENLAVKTFPPATKEQYLHMYQGL